MKQIFISFILLTCFAFISKAQITYTQSNCVYNVLATPSPIALSGGDDVVSANIPIGFNFSFYGTNYSTCHITTNGLLSFNAGIGSGCCSGGLLPSNPFATTIIAWAWDDMYTTGGGPYNYQTIGVAPNRIFIINYNNIGYCCSPSNAATVQIQLYETTNEIRFLSANNNHIGRTSTMGIQNGASSSVVPGRNASSWASAANECIAFTPVAPGPPTIASFTPASGCANGTSVVITGTNFTGATAVTFGGTNAQSFTVNSPTQITAIVGAGTTGTIAVTNPNGTGTSAGTFTVNPSIAPPTNVTATPASICAGATSNLNATSAGNTISWFTVPTGGVAAGTSPSGANFPVTPAVTTTYYAQAQSAGGNALVGGTVAQGALTLPDANGTPMSVVWNPVFSMYYSTHGGGPSSPTVTFNAAGVQQSTVASNFDNRGSWWNSNTSKFEGNSYGTVGYRAHDLNGSGWAIGSGVVAPVGQNQPIDQSMGGYDAANNETVFYNAGQIQRRNRTTGALVASGAITGLPPGSITMYWAAASGVPGSEIMIYDYTNRAVRFINRLTFAYTTSVQLAASAPQPTSYSVGYDGNGKLWLHNGSAWVHYQIITIGGGGPGGTQTFNYTGAVQNFTVPAGVTTLTIDARGAQGGTYAPATGGLGARMVGDVAVTPGQVLSVWVGQQGIPSQNAGGGGGASGVTNGATALVVAGAGGGGSTINGTENGKPGLTTTTGGSSSGAGGAAGNGGEKGYVSGDCGWAGGGGGFLGDGYGGPAGGDGGPLPGTLGGPAGGKSRANGGAGGIGGSCGFSGTGAGGWGCGGGARAEYGGGGGGGYSGGGGGQYVAPVNSRSGGGGGSFNSGANQSNTQGFQSGNGQVILTWAGGAASCPSSRVPVTVTVNPAPPVAVSASVNPLCSGNSTTMTATGASTYVYNPGNLSGAVQTVSPVVTTTYTVTGTSAAGCTATTTITITVNPTPAAPSPVTATPASICAGATSQLNSTGAVGSVQSWYTVPSGGVAIGTSPSGANFPVTPAVTTTYYVETAATIPPGSQTFNFTGAMQTFTVPAGVTSVVLNTFGAQGVGGGGFVPGNGGRAQGTMSVVPGQVLNVFVGGTNAYNGGGIGLGGSNGGGASDVRSGGVALANRVIVAGGGGGAGGDNWNCNVGTGHGGGGTAVGSNFVGGAGGAGYTPGTGCGTDGGNAGGTGGTGFHGGGGGGGGFISGGTGANANGMPAGNGTLGQGGASYNAPGCGTTGGGGGGYYGGGGAAGTNCGAGRGGGGSSWTGTLTSPLFVPGVQTGNGQVIISWLGGTGCPSSRVPVTVTVNSLPPTPVASASPATICAGETSVLNASNLPMGNVTIFTENFANNSQGWTLGTEWQIAPAVGSPPPPIGNPDPATDVTPTADNGVAGVVIGGAGTATTTLHAPYYITSPIINIAGLSTANLNFQRWLNSDYTPYMNNFVDVWNGASWVNIWQSGPSPAIFDAAWSLQTFNITPYINPNFQVRFGHEVASGGAFTITSWNIDDVTITGTAPASVAWTGPAVIANPALATTNVTPGTTGVLTYTVTVTGAGGCTSSNTTTLTVNSLPVVTASASPSAICPGGSSVLTGTGAATYAWNPGALVGSPTVTPVATTTYSLVGTDANGCTGTATVDVTVYTSPVVTASASPAAICIGGSSTLTGGGATTYAWDPGALVGSPTVSPIATTNYTVTGTDANGCTATSTVDVVVNGMPVVTATPATQTVCEMGMATVSGGGAATYAWTGGITDATPFMVMAPAVYTVTGTDANGCTNTATAEVLMNTLPVITAGATPATTCEMTTVTPSASGAITIGWSGGLTNNVPFVATATTTYTVTGTDGNGCTNSTTVLVTVTPMSGILAPATSNQSQDHGDDFDINYYAGNCDLIATVDDGAGGNVLGMTTSTVNVDATAGMHNGQPFVRRWYQITPTTNGAADVVLYINQSDFDDYNAAVLLPYLPLPILGNNADPNIANIRITKNADAGLGNSPVVITPTVNWNGTYWELSFNTPNFSQFRVHSVNPGNVPLPVTITHFSGLKLETSDKLSWTTSSEQNNAYFNLQHSTDGINFTTLAKVNSKAANGNSATPLTYSAINSKPVLGHNYYRLQQTDLDNKLSVHAQIVDLIWGANGSTVSIYPNPTTDILNIDLYAATAQNTTVKLLDMSGRVIKQIQAKSAVGMNNIKLSMGEVASGVYTIQVYENNTLSHTSKVKKND